MRVRTLALVAAFLAGALTGGVAIAATMTFTLTAAEVDVVTWKWKQADTGGSYASAQAWAEADYRNGTIAGWAAERKAFRKGKTDSYFCTNTWPGWNTTQKNAYCTGNQESSGCDPCADR